MQAFGHDDTFGSLVILQESRDDARECKGAAVEGMSQLHFAIGIFETQFHTVGLEGLEVGNGGDFEPFLLGSAPHFEVEGHGRGEADVAAAQFQYVVWQAQLVEETAHMVFHILQSVVAAFGVFDYHYLHLAEFMQAVQAAYILAIAARLAAETLAIADMADGQLVGRHNHVSVDIGDRHLGGGNHIEPVERDGIHLPLLVGQLAGTQARSLVDHQRGHDFHVASLDSLVEEKVDKGTLQTGTLALVDGKSGTGYLVAQFEIHYVIFGTEVPMGQSVIGQETKTALDKYGVKPDVIIGCCGGGSNFGGLIAPFMGEKLRGEADYEFIGVEPASCPSFTRGKYVYDFCDTGHVCPLAKMYTLGNEFIPSANHAGGLRYHGMSTILSELYDEGLIHVKSYEQTNVFEAAEQFARCEGILPAPESSHAIKGAIDEALKCKETGEEKNIVFGLTGTGYFDMLAYKQFNEGTMTDKVPTDEDIAKGLQSVPQFPGNEID